MAIINIIGIGQMGSALAFVAAANGNSAPLAALWVFIVGPLVGAALAAYTYKSLEK